MSKSSEKSVSITVGFLSALATVCAACIGGAFLIFNTMITHPEVSTHPTVSSTIPVIPSIPVSTSSPTIPWTPGKNHPEYLHVVASETEGNWIPAPGYEWDNPDDESDLGVVWSPGIEHDEHPNVISADTEGDWIPAPGYKWVNPDDDDDFRVIQVLGTVKSVEVEYDVYQEGLKGMKIHINFEVEELQEIRCNATAYFSYANGGSLKARANGSYSTEDGQVAVGREFIPKYPITDFDDFILFIPYEALNIDPEVDTIELKFIVKLYNWRDKSFIAESEEYYFTISQ